MHVDSGPCSPTVSRFDFEHNIHNLNLCGNKSHNQCVQFHVKRKCVYISVQNDTLRVVQNWAQIDYDNVDFCMMVTGEWIDLNENVGSSKQTKKNQIKTLNNWNMQTHLIWVHLAHHTVTLTSLESEATRSWTTDSPNSERIFCFCATQHFMFCSEKQNCLSSSQYRLKDISDQSVY